VPRRLKKWPMRSQMKPKPPLNHNYRVGRVQRQCLRALRAARGKPVSTWALVEWAFPGSQRAPWHRWWSVKRSVRRWAEPVGRRRARGGEVLWRLRDDV